MSNEMEKAYMKGFAVIGKSAPITDAREKATGQAVYVDDLKFPQMLYGKILRSPHPHTRILNIDTSKAEKVPGVKAVITAEDTPKKKWGAFIQDQYILAVDKARYVGDELAAIAATDESTAEEALGLIKVDYDVLPAVFDPEEAVLPGAPLIHEGAENNIANRIDISRGDVRKGFEKSEYIFEDRFTTSMVHPCFTEPTASVAQFDINGRLTLWAPIQYIFLVRRRLSVALDMSVSAMRVIQTKVGGAFGGKVGDEHSIPINCILAKVTGKPVKIVMGRDEEFISTGPRVPAVIYLKLGIKKDGTFMAKDTRIFSDNGAYSRKGPSVMTNTAMRSDNLYRHTNIKTEAKLVYTNKSPTGSYRGFGNPQMAFAMESAIDVVAERLHIDPVEIRLKNAVHAGDTTVHGWKIRSCGYSDCLEKAAAMVDWKKLDRSGPNRF